MIGIYKIFNKITKRFYIGSSGDIPRRWRSHRNLLKNNKHHNIFLQREYNKYGKDAFIYEVVCETSIETLLEKEQELFESLDVFGDKGYNIAFEAARPMAGKKHTEEVKEILRKKLSGRNHPHFGKEVSQEWRRNISKARKRFSDEEEISFFLRNAEGESLTSIAKSVGAHTTTITRAVQRVKKFNYMQDLKCDDGQ